MKFVSVMTVSCLKMAVESASKTLCVAYTPRASLLTGIFARWCTILVWKLTIFFE
jgi:hypothetical protein